MNLGHLFDAALRARAADAALEFEGETYTFGEIEKRANRMAAFLTGRGLGKGDRIAAYLANSPSMIDLYLACIKTGIIFVPINILYREREVSHIVRDAEPAAVIANGDAPGVSDAWQLNEVAREASALPAEPPGVTLDGDDPAAIIYTSGTTGQSKGAVLTHNNFAANAVNLIVSWRFTSSDRLLLGLPLFHVHGLGNGLHCWLLSGCRMRLLPRFEHHKAAAEFRAFQPTVFFGVPANYVRLLDLGDEASALGASMRLFVSGSAPLPAHVLEEFETKFGHRILERYGMTETLMNISNPYYGERRAGAVGFPLPGVSVEIRDPAGRTVGDETEGELYIRGPNVFREYWRKPEATAAAIQNGWFRTGDMGVRSRDGYYTLKGRASDLIISGGFNIYPREIEEFLLEQTGVREAAVAGLPDRVRGEIPVAYIVPGEGFDAAAVEAKCRATFASFKTPRAFLTVASLPRTALGKVQKHLLPKPE
jgi:malonyl-CoA/methylmalonyl-CoA synthetase